MVTSTQERRERKAERTRAAIVDAAAELFDRDGVFSTTVEKIAEAADVSPASVYALVGGKAGILTRLMDDWASAAADIDVPAVLAGCRSVAEVVQAVGAASAAVHARHGRTMRIALATAPHEPDVAASTGAAFARYRGSLGLAAARVVELRGDGMPADETGALLWLHFGYGAWNALVGDLGMPFEDARRRLVAWAARALEA